LKRRPTKKRKQIVTRKPGCKANSPHSRAQEGGLEGKRERRKKRFGKRLSSHRATPVKKTERGPKKREREKVVSHLKGTKLSRLMFWTLELQVGGVSNHHPKATEMIRDRIRRVMKEAQRGQADESLHVDKFTCPTGEPIREIEVPTVQEVSISKKRVG